MEFFPQRAIVEKMATTMLSLKSPTSSQKVGTSWVAHLVKRHSKLSSVYNLKFDVQIAEGDDPKLISLRFKLGGNTIANHGIVEEDIFNFDGIGFQMGVTATSKVITASDRKDRLRTK